MNTGCCYATSDNQRPGIKNTYYVLDVVQLGVRQVMYPTEPRVNARVTGMLQEGQLLQSDIFRSGTGHNKNVF